MKLLLALLLASAMVQTQEPPQRHDKYREDAKAYCWNPRSSGTQVKQRERDPHGHRCSCHLHCQVGSDGQIVSDYEDATCELYCTRDRCQCHIEEPCEMPH